MASRFITKETGTHYSIYMWKGYGAKRSKDAIWDHQHRNTAERQINSLMELHNIRFDEMYECVDRDGVVCFVIDASKHYSS